MCCLCFAWCWKRKKKKVFLKSLPNPFVFCWCKMETHLKAKYKTYMQVSAALVYPTSKSCVLALLLLLTRLTSRLDFWGRVTYKGEMHIWSEPYVWEKKCPDLLFQGHLEGRTPWCSLVVCTKVTVIYCIYIYCIVTLIHRFNLPLGAIRMYSPYTVCTVSHPGTEHTLMFCCQYNFPERFPLLLTPWWDLFSCRFHRMDVESML